MIYRGRAWYFRSFSVANATSEVLPAFISRLFLLESRAKKPLKYHALPLLIILLSSHFLFASSLCAAEVPKRIVSLAPNVTEILFALGLEDRIAGVTNFCDYPEEAKTKPKIGGMSNPSLEAVVSLKPDIVILTTDGNPKKIKERLGSLNIKTYVFRARRLRDLPLGIRDMGSALGVEKKAAELAEKIEIKINALTASRLSINKKVLFIVWPKPLIVAGPGTVIDDALTLIGGVNIAAGAKTNYPKYSIEEILRRAPDFIFIGRGHEDMQKVSSGLLGRLRSVPAVKNGKVFFVSDLLYRLGPRTVKGIEELAGHMEE